MSPETEAQLLDRLAALEKLVREGLSPRPVLTTAEAMELANCGSDSAFYRWAQTWRVSNCGQGRYSRRAILLGLEREATSCLRRSRSEERKAA